WIRCKKSVVTHVPPGGMRRILGMIENRDADVFAVDRSAVVAPRSALAPGRAVGVTVGVDDPPGAAPAVLALADHEADALVDAHTQRAFLGVAEYNLSVRCLESDLQIEDITRFDALEAVAGRVGADDLIVGRDPLV